MEWNSHLSADVAACALARNAADRQAPPAAGGGGAEDVVRVEVAARAHVRPGLPVRARPSGDFSSRVCHGMLYCATESRCDGSGILEFPGNLAGLGFVQDFDG